MNKQELEKIELYFHSFREGTQHSIRHGERPGKNYFHKECDNFHIVVFTDDGSVYQEGTEAETIGVELETWEDIEVRFLSFTGERVEDVPADNHWNQQGRLKDKLLIWKQDADVVNFYEIIDRSELEPYIQNWAKRHIEERAHNMTIRFLSFLINDKDGNVDIRFEYDEYGNRGDGTKFPAGEYWYGFSIIELEKMPTWDRNDA